MRKVKQISTIILILLIVATVAWGIDQIYTTNRHGVIVDPGQLHTAKKAWVVIDAHESDSTEPTALGNTEKTYLTVVAAIAAASSGDEEISIYGDDQAERLVMSGWNTVKFRCIGTTNGGVITYQIYFGTLEPGDTDCELVKVGQLAFVIGQQASITTDYEMADTLVVTPYCWSKSWGTASPVADLCAEARIDMMEANIIVALCSSANCDAKLIATGH